MHRKVSLLLTLAVLLSHVVLNTARAQDDFAMDLLDELETSFSSEWIDKAFQRRRIITIADPAIELHKGKYVWITSPDPVLMVNTGILRSDLADLKAVDMKGKEFDCGVVDFPLDDGHCMIWLALPADRKKTGVQFYLYYDNPKAKHSGKRQTVKRAHDAKPFDVIVSPEQTNGKAKDLQGRSPIFDDLIVAEVETFLRPDGAPAIAHAKYETPYVLGTDNPTGGSGGLYVAPTIPWRPAEIESPRVITKTITIPRKGNWQIHTRYRVQDYYPITHRVQGGQPVRYFYPFQLAVGEQTWTVGEDQSQGADFRWQTIEAELPAGEQTITITMDKLSCADVVVLTQNKTWIPDARDLTGPTWLRVKMTDNNKAQTMPDVYCVHTPWSSHGPQGDTQAYLTTDRPIFDEKEAKQAFLQDKETTLAPGEWSPWVQLAHSEFPLWWTNVRFIERLYGGVRPIPFDNRKVAFELATRPSEHRVVRRGNEKVDDRGLMLMMASSLTLEDALTNVRSFAQWADERYQYTVDLGLKHGEGPKRMRLATMFRCWSEKELEYNLDTLGRIGFNTFTARVSEEQIAPILKKFDMPFYSFTHHWYPKIELTEYDQQPKTGETYEDVVKRVILAEASITYDPSRVKYESWPRRQAWLITMGDEIGPFTNSNYINALPAMKGYFHEYLQKQNLTPDFFGKTTWAELDALDYVELGKIGRAKMQSIDPDYQTDEQRAASERDAAILQNTLTQGATEATNTAWDEAAGLTEGDKADAAQLKADSDNTPITEKRLYHWTQKFKGHYTGMVLGEGTRQIAVAHKDGKLAYQPIASPNFQAMPAMRGFQWNGALNIFDLARNNDLNFIQVEDWTWCPYKVAFGALFMRASVRKQGQPFGVLIVGGNPIQRATADLAIGAESFVSYLYGPLRVIGPPWADDKPSQRQWATFARWLGKYEDIIPQTKLRVPRAAILVANTTEMNRAFFDHYPRERQYMFVALADARYGVDVVSEEEIIEDDALSQYDVLYVGDSHVYSSAQEKIKTWVEGGGVLWSTYDGLARQEYDEKTNRFDEVFGFKSRARIAPEFGKEGPDTFHQITLDKTDYFPAQTIDQIAYKVDFDVDSATIIGRYDDGKPAATMNAFGKGHAFFIGCRADQFSGDYNHTTTEEPVNKDRRKVVAAAMEKAGIGPIFSSPQDRAFMYVRDGEDLSMLFVISTLDAPKRNIEIDMTLPKQPKQAETGLGEAIEFKVLDSVADGVNVRVIVPVESRGAEMVVFKY